MQPLDVAFMKPLSTYYNQECEKWLRMNPGRVITTFQIGSLFGSAYCRSATTEVAMNGFRKTGIQPLNEDVFSDVDFAPSDVTDQPYGEDGVEDVANVTATSSDDDTSDLQPSTSQTHTRKDNHSARSSTSPTRTRRDIHSAQPSTSQTRKDNPSTRSTTSLKSRKELPPAQPSTSQTRKDNPSTRSTTSQKSRKELPPAQLSTSQTRKDNPSTRSTTSLKSRKELPPAQPSTSQTRKDNPSARSSTSQKSRNELPPAQPSTSQTRKDNPSNSIVNWSGSQKHRIQQILLKVWPVVKNKKKITKSNRSDPTPIESLNQNLSSRLNQCGTYQNQNLEQLVSAESEPAEPESIESATNRTSQNQNYSLKVGRWSEPEPIESK